MQDGVNDDGQTEPMSRFLWKLRRVERLRAIEIAALISPPVMMVLFHRLENGWFAIALPLSVAFCFAYMVQLLWETLRRRRKLWELSLGIILFVFSLASTRPAADLGSIWLYKSMEQELWACVNQYESDPDLGWTKIPVPSDLSHIVDTVWGTRYEDGSTSMEFFTWGMFPVHHRGLLYSKGESPEMATEIQRRWPGQYWIDENWRRVSD